MKDSPATKFAGKEMPAKFGLTTTGEDLQQHKSERFSLAYVPPPPIAIRFALHLRAFKHLCLETALCNNREL